MPLVYLDNSVRDEMTSLLKEGIYVRYQAGFYATGKFYDCFDSASLYRGKVLYLRAKLEALFFSRIYRVNGGFFIHKKYVPVFRKELDNVKRLFLDVKKFATENRESIIEGYRRFFERKLQKRWVNSGHVGKLPESFLNRAFKEECNKFFREENFKRGNFFKIMPYNPFVEDLPEYEGIVNVKINLEEDIYHSIIKRRISSFKMLRNFRKKLEKVDTVYGPCKSLCTYLFLFKSSVVYNDEELIELIDDTLDYIIKSFRRERFSISAKVEVIQEYLLENKKYYLNFHEDLV